MDSPMECMEVWLADIRTLAPQEEQCMALLPTGRRASARAFRHQEGRLHSAAAGLLLRRVLGVRADSQLRTGPWGKPELAGEGPQFCLSHAGDYAALAVFSSPVGVDIEPMKELPPVIPRKEFNREELDGLEAEPGPEKFWFLWTRLESALKADGRGLTAARSRDFSVVGRTDPWCIESFTHDGHMISCAAGRPFRVRMRVLTAEELLQTD